MSAENERIRREMGAGMSMSDYRMSEQAATVRDITPRPKILDALMIGGVWFVHDGTQMRPATVDEVKELFGES